MKKLLITISVACLLLGTTPVLSQSNATDTFDTRVPALPAEADVTSVCPSGSMPAYEEEAKDSGQDFTCVPMPQSAKAPAPVEPVENPPVEAALPTPATVSPSPIAPIGTGGMIFGETRMGCYADRDRDGKTRIAPFFEDKIGDWVEADHYDTKQSVAGTDVYMICEASHEGLTVLFAAAGFPSVSFSQTWN